MRTITALHSWQDGHRLTKPLIVRHVRDRNDKPLCIVHNLPGLDAELHPDRLEALGRQLIYAAHDARLGAQGERQYPDDAAPVRHEATPGFFEYPDEVEHAD